MLRLRLVVLGLTACAAIGCERPPYEVAPVSGVVTINDKPAARVAVMFQPIAPEGQINPGPGSFGITDENGHYSLKLVGLETPGAVVGQHKVRLEDYYDPPTDSSNDRPVRRPAPANPVPRRYGAVEAPFEFDVTKKGSTAGDFKLKSP